MLEECFKQSAVGGVLQAVCSSSTTAGSFTLKATRSFETPGTNDTSARRHMPEGSNPHQYRCENLKSRNVYLHISINDTFEDKSL